MVVPEIPGNCGDLNHKIPDAKSETFGPAFQEVSVTFECGRSPKYVSTPIGERLNQAVIGPPQLKFWDWFSFTTCYSLVLVQLRTVHFLQQ